MCEEHKLRPAQMKFPQPKCRQWTWMHPTGSKHQFDNILINSKWSNFSRPKFDWNKLQDAATREYFQIDLSNRFEALQCNETSAQITERYEELFEHAASEVAEKVVGKRRPCGMPNWVANKTIQLKSERDKAKRRFLVSKSRKSRERW